jgi:SagB-type dehydrogenase family enzyme
MRAIGFHSPISPTTPIRARVPGFFPGVFLAVLALGMTIRAETVSLPEPIRSGPVSVEQALELRRSVRAFSDSSLSLAEAGQLLWAAQGVTRERGRRTAPSAGATYPLEVYLVAGNVEELEPGIYRYLPGEHGLEPVTTGDRREDLAAACLGQQAVRRAALSLVIGAEFSRTAKRYGKRAERYVYLEAGHAAENVCLECVALGLGMVCVGAFEDAAVKRVLEMKEAPVYVLPVGREDSD